MKVTDRYLSGQTYIGSAISTYGVAWMAEGDDWNVKLVLWFLIAISGMVSCLIAIRQPENNYIHAIKNRYK